MIWLLVEVVIILTLVIGIACWVFLPQKNKQAPPPTDSKNLPR